MQAKPSNSAYQLLNKRPSPPRPQVHMSLHDFKNSSYPRALGHGAFALDFEANTNKPHHPDLYVRTMAVSNNDCVVGVDFLGCSDDDWQWLMEWLPQQKLIVFNALYDNSVLYRKSGHKGALAPYADLYVAFKKLGGKKKFTDRLATHSLKSAQVQLLGWQDKGNDEINEYMKQEGLSWADVKEFDSELLLRYNCLDADSTWSLYLLFKELAQEHSETWGQYFGQWHREECMTSVALWVEALSYGLPIDEAQLEVHRQDCERNKDLYLQQFMNHPQLKEGIAAYNKQVVDNLRSVEPPKHKKDGQITARWHKWAYKLEGAENTNHFNTNSVPQLQWLLYEYAKLPVPKLSDAGRPSTDAESLNAVGEIGQLLLNYRKMTTELKFVTQLADNNINGVFYPSTIYPGTDTGRVVSREDIA